MDDIDYEFTVEDAQEHVSQYPKYLELKMIFSENGEEREGSDENYAFVTKYRTNLFRYIMNEDRIFQVGEDIYRVFENIVFRAPIDNFDILLEITENNVQEYIERIYVAIAGGYENELDYSIFTSRLKSATQTSGSDGDENSSSGVNTAGACGRTNGNYNRSLILNRSPVASNNQEVVLGEFYCYSYKKNTTLWRCIAGYEIYAWWKGKCKRCVWIGCKRTLNTDFHMEIWYDNNLYHFHEQYKTSKPVKKINPTIFTRDTPLNVNQSVGSIYNMCGKYWIATTSCEFDE